MARSIDYSGRRCGHLTLIARVRDGASGVGATWIALCDCGNRREVIAKDAARGRVRTCGKCQLAGGSRARRPQRVDARTRDLRAGYSRLVRQSLRDGSELQISPSEFEELSLRPCLYCRSVIPVGRAAVGKLNHHQPYTPDNAITVCPLCIQMQGNLPVDTFLHQVQKISQAIETAVDTLGKL